MKRKHYILSILIVFNLVLLSLFSCDSQSPISENNENATSINPDEDDLKVSSTPLSEQDFVISRMKPWQIEYVKQNNLLDNTLISHYAEQEGMLELAGYDMEETPEETLLLDEYHIINGWWYLMRENMTILYTEEYNNRRYSVILTVGGEGCNNLHVVFYDIKDDDKMEVLEHVTGNIPISSGFYPNIRTLNNEIVFFGMTKENRYEPTTDKNVPSNFATIEIVQSDGTSYNQAITSKQAIVVFYPSTIKPVSCKILNDSGETIETYDAIDGNE